MDELYLLGKRAKEASKELLSVSQEKINETLLTSAKLLRENKELLKAENKKDIDNAISTGKSEGFIDRLTLTDKVIDAIAEGIEQVARLTSPVGKLVYSYENKEQGIAVEKKNVPFGAIGIIYESRPNVTADAFALCFKTQNAVILRGGSDAINTNKIICKIIRQALETEGVNQNAIAVLEDTSRETATRFMQMKEYLDLLIPRGGASLINNALQNATVPIIETGLGNCHIFVDESANIEMAVNTIFNAKTQRYSVCNALESIVIHSNILPKALPEIAKKLDEKSVELRLDQRALQVLPDRTPATEEDFYTEYGGPIISVKTVDCLEEAIAHINEHSTHHSDSIITENQANADRFMKEIDSSSVYHNCSTRFTDGFVFGLGAEIGISTQKLHARGPMGLEALVTTKYYIKGNGAVRK